jgi:hypothetical protein
VRGDVASLSGERLAQALVVQGQDLDVLSESVDRQLKDGDLLGVPAPELGDLRAGLALIEDRALGLRWRLAAQPESPHRVDRRRRAVAVERLTPASAANPPLPRWPAAANRPEERTRHRSNHENNHQG